MRFSFSLCLSLSLSLLRSFLARLASALPPPPSFSGFLGLRVVPKQLELQLLSRQLKYQREGGGERERKERERERRTQMCL